MATGTTDAQLVKKDLPWSRQIAFGFQIRAIQTAIWLGSLREKPDIAHAPNLVKTYNVRRHLPVRIFLPSSYTAAGSSQPLPTLFTIHGGGFCIGTPQDDDAWNRNFADKHSILVIALNYSKAPAAPFPTGLDDLEALYLAALDDETLPIDRANGGRVAIAGFSAGGNLTLSLSQRISKLADCACRPRAAVTVYGALDLSRAPEAKILTRQYKTDSDLGSPRDAPTDFLLGMAPLFDWSYMPTGQDLRDPFLSPGPYADSKDLPPHVFVIASELDMLSNDSRECANRLARARGSKNPLHAQDFTTKPENVRVGRPEVGKHGELELDDERFAWQETFPDGSVRWLLVPDVLHAFDSLPMRKKLGGGKTVEDAELKTEAYCNLLGDWLLKTVF